MGNELARGQDRGDRCSVVWGSVVPSPVLDAPRLRREARRMSRRWIRCRHGPLTRSAARRRLLPFVVVGLAVAMSVVSCTFTTNLDSLSNGNCPAGQKACERRCVPESDPNFGCALIGCTPCLFNNATAGCSQHGECAILACVKPFANCDTRAENGCEVDLDHDPAHCGSCSSACGAIAHGTPGCTSQHCAVGACDAGWGDCNNSVTDGCETPLNTNAHCGRCEVQCAAPQACLCATDGGGLCGCG
jgi:hypothetical protein